MPRIALVLAAMATATGFYFHALDYGTIRDGWFAGHVAISCLMIAAVAWWFFRQRSRDGLVTAFQILLALLFATGWLALSAWGDRGNIGDWLGPLALPSLPGISYDLGNFGEQSHKLLVTIALFNVLVIGSYSLWRRRK